MARPRLLFLRGARQLLTLRGGAPRRGLLQSDLGLIRDGGVLIEGEKIDQVGMTRRLENLAKARQAQVIDVSGKVLLPGFVDAHTQSLSSSPALRPFETRIAGAPADELGGSPTAPRSQRELRRRARRWTYLAAAMGTTTAEVRTRFSGDPQADLKMLRATNALDGDPLDVLNVFTAGQTLGHRASRGSAREIYDMVGRLGGSPRLAYACDVVCGGGGFGLAAGRRLLSWAKRCGLEVKVQAESQEPNPSVRLAVETGALSLDRWDPLSDLEMDMLAQSAVITTLLPGVAFHRGAADPPSGRKLIDRGAPVALASGFSPGGTPSFGMPTTIALACREMRLMPEEAIVACTINAAAAVGRAASLGSIEPGKQADLAVFDVADYREIPYFFGANLCSMTIKRGRVIFRAGAPPGEIRLAPPGDRA